MPESDDPPESPSRRFERRRELLLSIIKQNDQSRPQQYIASYPPEAILAPKDTYSEDTFLITATHGGSETLRALSNV